MNVTCSFPEQFLYRTEESRLLDLADVELIPADDKARDMFPFRKQSEPDAETLDQSQATQHVGGYRGHTRDAPSCCSRMIPSTRPISRPFRSTTSLSRRSRASSISTPEDFKRDHHERQDGGEDGQDGEQAITHRTAFVFFDKPFVVHQDEEWQHNEGHHDNNKRNRNQRH